MIMTKLKQPNLNNPHVLVLLGLVIIVCSCSSKKKMYDAQLFTFSYSGKKEVMNIAYSDFSGIFLFNNTDTAYYNFGYNVSTLTESIPELVIIPDVSDEEIEAIAKDNHDKQFTNVRNADIDRLRKQNLFFLYRDNQIWKYLKPIDTSKYGITGLYVDSMLVDSKGVVRFNFYFKKLIKMSYLEAEEIIKSIRMKNNVIKKIDFYSTNIME